MARMQFGLIVVAMIFSTSSVYAGGSGGGGTRNEKQILCQDAWGNQARVEVFGNGLEISSARYGNTGFMRANGSTSTSYYFRNGTGSVAIVHRSVLSDGEGKISYRPTDRESRPREFVLRCP